MFVGLCMYVCTQMCACLYMHTCECVCRFVGLCMYVGCVCVCVYITSSQAAAGVRAECEGLCLPSHHSHAQQAGGYLETKPGSPCSLVANRVTRHHSLWLFSPCPLRASWLQSRAPAWIPHSKSSSRSSCAVAFHVDSCLGTPLDEGHFWRFPPPVLSVNICIPCLSSCPTMLQPFSQIGFCTFLHRTFPTWLLCKIAIMGLMTRLREI